jgi:hypothetical protein
MSVNHSASLETVFCAAIRTCGRSGVGDVEENTGMHAPERSVWSGTENGKIFRTHFNNLVRAGRGSDIRTHGYS